MATLLSSGTSNGAGTGQSHTGPCTVIANNTSVFDGAIVHIQIADSDTAGEYVDLVDHNTILRGPGALNIQAYGTYFLRTFVEKAGANTSLNITTIQ